MPRVKKEETPVPSPEAAPVVPVSIEDLVGGGSQPSQAPPQASRYTPQNRQQNFIPNNQYGPRRNNFGYRNNNSYGQGQQGFVPQQQFNQQPMFQRGNDLNDANIPTQELSGVLDLQSEGHGYLRPKFVPSDKDIYISASQIRRFNLRAGDKVEGVGRPPKESERYFGLLRVDKVNGLEAEKALTRPDFNDLVPVYPDRQIKMETGKSPLSTRIIDLIAPIGRGQRGLVVSPPKAGKTTILKEIANGITTNYPDYHLMVALVGERPEEVTDISRSVVGEVIASNFDEPPGNQTRVAEIALDRAKRLVEQGTDVVLLLDSITRLARAYNLAVPSSGRTLSGGFDPSALFPPKKFLGAARCIENGGSLTIIGTALVDTDSRMDDLIYEEFKGTGNMELHLDRRLAEKRIFPAINIIQSSTRNFERFFTDDEVKARNTLVRMLDLLTDDERTQMFLERLAKTESNEEFFKTLTVGG